MDHAISLLGALALGKPIPGIREPVNVSHIIRAAHCFARNARFDEDKDQDEGQDPENDRTLSDDLLLSNAY